jgi:hypothetical protein
LRMGVLGTAPPRQRQTEGTCQPLRNNEDRPVAADVDADVAAPARSAPSPRPDRSWSPTSSRRRSATATSSTT